MGALDWLRRRDPGYRIARRATRVTLVASVGFYSCKYGLGNNILATYTLFGTTATGALSQVPGAPRERARTLLAALPVAWVLVTAGTLAAVHTWTAAAGMLVVGFAVSFAGVGGARLVGLAAGFQLFYILPCFPPHAPHTLGARLAGVTLGVVLLAVAEVVVWPDPPPVTYQQRLADAAEAVAGFVEAVAHVLSCETGAHEKLAPRREQAYRWVDQARLSRLPRTERPASASARDRAARDAAASLRQVLRHADRLLADPRAPETPDPDAARLLQQTATTTRSAGRTVLGGTPPVTVDELAAAGAAFEEIRARPRTGLPHDLDVARIREDAIALQTAEHVRAFATAARIAAGLPVAVESAQPGERKGMFWYAHEPAISLYWQQFRLHLTPRSIYFQGALRVALALAAARAVAGALHLANGFWVLLATLTLLRTSAAGTRTTLRPALVGTLIGAGASSGLLLVAHRPAVYAVLLPLTMVLAFGVGPLLGLAWAQGLTTVMLTMIFAQLTPAQWQLAEVRLVDVLVGVLIGVLAGFLVWPHGGGGELRRTIADYLQAGAAATEETVEVLAGTNQPRGSLDAAHRAMLLAEASFTQYQSEPDDPRMTSVNWDAALIAGHQMVRGGESLLRRNPPGFMAPWPDTARRLTGFTKQLRPAYVDLAEQLRGGRVTRPVPAPPAPDDVLDRVHAIIDGGETCFPVLRLVDVEVWLADLTEDVERIQRAR